MPVAAVPVPSSEHLYMWNLGVPALKALYQLQVSYKGQNKPLFWNNFPIYNHF